MTTDSTHEARIVPGEASAEMIEAGETVLEKADEDLRNYVSGVTTDWDYGMIAEAVWRAMWDAATPSAPPADLEAESRELLADALAWADRSECLAWIEAAVAGTFNAAGSKVSVQGALAAIQRARALSARRIAPPPSVEADAITDTQVMAHHRYRDLHEDFVTVETDLREIAIMVGHHYNSCKPVAPKVAALITRLSGGEVERLREALEPFAKALGDGAAMNEPGGAALPLRS